MMMSNLILVPLLISMFFTSGGLGLNVSSCIEKERQALLDVKANLTDPYGRLDGWGSKGGEMDCCKWRGVICDSLTGHVIELHFYDGYLSDGCRGVGKISPSLQVLTHLQFLDLSSIDFQCNPLPTFLGSLSNLKHLYISNANLCGPIPHQLANLSNLLELYLYNNSLDGSIPYSLGDLISSLNTLDLSENLLSGSLPSFVNCSSLTDMNLADNSLNGSMPDLTRCTNLGSLNVSRNSFNGILPNFMGCPNSLWKLDMSGNQFSGIVPNSLGQLSNLEYLDLSSNSLEGVISEIHFLNLTQLSYLDLSLNSLALDLRFHGESPFQLDVVKLQSCKLGPKFPMWIKTQKNISYLDISNAGISDNMPTWFSGLSSLLLFMNLSSNEIKGNLPNMSNIGSVYPNTSSWPGIDLSYNYFEGKVPLLPRKMAALNLSGNRFSGTLSFLCEIEGLTFLDLSNNSFSGSLPDCWLNFQKTLVVLNLSNNNLSGKIPYSLGFLSRLEAMYLRTNAFVGEVPLLSNCTRLRFLDLWGNKLSGFIPEWIGEALSELYVLDLGSNSFRGRLPSQVCWLHNLQFLDLSDNELSGNILGCFDNFTAMATRNSGLQLMKSIDLSRNNLSGEVPHEVTRLYELVSLNLSINKLHGEVPKDIGQLKNLKVLDLSKNKFSGCIPSSLSQITFLSYLGLSYNYIEGKVPLLPRVAALNLSGNRFSGTLSFLCEIEEFVTFLDLSNNSFSGSLPDCWLKFQKTLVVLNLSNNNLSGKIPSSLGFLSRLEAMSLRTNAFVGEVPLSLSNCTRLGFLDLWGNKLSGSIPESIGEALSELYVLDLGSNRFCGKLPSQLCRLRNLQVLDLSNNELSGNILGCFDSFTAMATKNLTNDMSKHSYSFSSYRSAEYLDNAWVTWKGKDRSFGRSGLQLMKSIDLSRNNFSGEVPHEITHLSELVSLNLSINNLYGEVPKDIGQLLNLDSLDLSRNNFSGRIPSSLSKITFLSYLDLSFNNFSGRIPTGSQLQSFDNAYNGNPQLCGPPLARICGFQPFVEENDEEDEDDCWKSYYTGMGSGFAAGFLGICGVIIVNRRCRYVIFASLSYIKDWIYVTMVVYFGKLGRKFRRRAQ